MRGQTHLVFGPSPRTLIVGALVCLEALRWCFGVEHVGSLSVSAAEAVSVLVAGCMISYGIRMAMVEKRALCASELWSECLRASLLQGTAT